MNKTSIFFLAICAFLSLANDAKASTFNPEYIISDEEMLDARSMSLGDIELFLRSKGGYISKNMFQSFDGQLKTAAQIIYDAANNYDCYGVTLSANPTREERAEKCRPAPINPKLLLVLLQKEQSLIEDTSPTQKQLDWATGYAVCDSCSMSNPAIQKWKGFGKQINSASLQFSDYLFSPDIYTYKAGNTYTISNTGRPASVVTIQNQATAALYNYTPHVYNGNFNFWNLWNRYFNRSYPNNSLLQAKGETGIWLLSNGKRRPFLSKGALTSRFDLSKVIQVNKSDLEAYPIGDPIKFAQYSLVRSPKGTVFLIVDDFKRGFNSQEAFRKIGYNPEEIIDATWDDLKFYKDGSPITTETSYPTGALLQNKKTGGIFYVSDGTKAPLIDRIFLLTRFKGKSITPVDPAKLDTYKTVEPYLFGDGEILKSADSPAVYVIDGMKKRPLISGEAFERLGYKWNNIITIPSKILAMYPIGEPLGELPQEPIIEAPLDIASSSTSTLEIISDQTGTASGTASSSAIASTTLDDLAEEISDIINP